MDAGETPSISPATAAMPLKIPWEDSFKFLYDRARQPAAAHGATITDLCASLNLFVPE